MSRFRPRNCRPGKNPTPNPVEKTSPSIRWSNKNISPQGTFADPRNPPLLSASAGHLGGEKTEQSRPFCPIGDFARRGPPDPPLERNHGRSGLQRGSARVRRRGRGWSSPPCSAPAASRSSSPCPCRACREVEGGPPAPPENWGDPLKVPDRGSPHHAGPPEPHRNFRPRAISAFEPRGIGLARDLRQCNFEIDEHAALHSAITGCPGPPR